MKKAKDYMKAIEEIGGYVPEYIINADKDSITFKLISGEEIQIERLPLETMNNVLSKLSQDFDAQVVAKILELSEDYFKRV